MRISPYAIPVALLLLFQLSLVESVSDENICAEKCDYCCRNKQCQSKDTCKGNYKTFIILGAIVGGIILLFVLRYLYVQYRRKNAQRQPKQKSTRAKSSRWKTRVKKPSSSTDEKKSKSKTKKAKPVKKELLPKRSDEVFLNAGDNDSIITPDTTSKKDDDLEKGPKSDRKGNSRNELKPNSQSVLKSDRKPSSKSEIKDKEESAKLKDEKKVDMTGSKAMKASKAESTSAKPRSASAKKGDKDKMTSSKGGDKMTSSKAGDKMTSSKAGQRGRSPGPGKDKERSSSQKKSTSKGPLKGDDKKPKKNQV